MDIEAMQTPSGLAVPLLVVALALPAAAQPPAVPEIDFGGGPRGKPPLGRSEIDRALAARDYARAERLLADAIARQPSSRALLIQIAGIFMLDRKPLNAAIALKKAEAIAPLDPPSRLQLALAYIAMKQGEWARPELERLVAADPDDVLYPYWLARLDYDAGQYASAVRRLQDVVTRAPAFSRAHDNLGLCYEALNQPEEAVSHYREAVRLNRVETPPSAWPALNLGILLRSRGELPEAEGLFREALRYDSRFAPGYYQLGALLEQAGRMDEAVNALKQAAAADAVYAEPYYALARIYRRQGRTADADAAIVTFEKLHQAQRARQEPPGEFPR